MREMDKLRNRYIQYLLLCVLWIMADAMSWSAEHSSMGVYASKSTISQEDAGEITLFLLNVIVHMVGKKLDSSYVCPVYCEVNHKHRIRNYEAKTKQSTDEKADSTILRWDGIASRK